jgi:hypothetical protein
VVRVVFTPHVNWFLDAAERDATEEMVCEVLGAVFRDLPRRDVCVEIQR